MVHHIKDLESLKHTVNEGSIGSSRHIKVHKKVQGNFSVLQIAHADNF